MSSRRRRSSPSSSRSSSWPPAAAATGVDEQVVVADLVSRLRVLLPLEAGVATAANGKASRAEEVLREACRYIRRLHAEADGLAERLSQLLEEPSAGHVADDGAAGAQLIRALLM